MGPAKNIDSHSVAVTGLSCRFPGDGDTLDSFWKSICAGKCKPFILLVSIQRQVEILADPELQRHGQRSQRSALI